MQKLNLKDVTLIAVTGKNLEGHLEALTKSMEQIEFGATVLVWKNFETIDDWNEYIIHHLKDHFATSHCLLIHQDGYVIHPELWKNEWLDYDWCSSPWPLSNDSFSYRTPKGKLVRVGNSVGLRSKKLCELISTRPMDYHYGNNNEDGQICVWERDWLEEQGCKFMPFEEALIFGRETLLPEYTGNTFLFHK